MTDRRRHSGKLERAMYRSRWRDGLLDLFGGLGVTVLGWSLGSGSSWTVLLTVPLLVMIWSFVRGSVVEPRIGRATFSRGWIKRESDGTRGAALFGIVAVPIFVTHHLLTARGPGLPSAWNHEWMASVPTAFLVLLSLTTAMVLGLRRFLLYAIMFLAAGSIGERVGADVATQFLFVGAVVSSTGSFLFARFLLAHPHLPAVADMD